MTSSFWKYDLAVFAAILAIITVHLVRLGNYPGLYLDAINPDYIAVQLLYPQDLQTRWQIAWPWLDQIYHGNNGIIITLLSVLVTGSTGIIQYHITYGIVASLAVFLSYLLLTHRAVGVSRLWAGLGSLILISWPSLFTIIITQFYMCLFGSVCVLGGILLFLDWLDDAGAKWKHSFCYFLFGIAFYSYFNFLFFLPSLVLCTVLALRHADSLSLDNVIVPLVAYMLGCGLYIVGWSQIALVMGGVDMGLSRRIKLFLAVYAVLTATFVLFYARIRVRKPLLGYLIAGAGLWAVKVLPAVSESATGLGIVQDTSFAEKISTVIRDYSFILSGWYAEGMIMGKAVSVFSSYALLIFVISVLIAFAAELLSRKRNAKWKIPAAVIAVYLCCCVALGTRMQPQHYVPLVFITFLGFVLCLRRVFECVSESGNAFCRRIAGFKAGILTVLVLCLMSLNLFNEAKIISEIRSTGGDRLWASEMTDLANEAMERRDGGAKEVFVFKDWGFFTGFDYLTMNRIPYVVTMDIPLLSRQYSEGRDIIACYWNKADTASYADDLKSIGGGNAIVTGRVWTDRNGRTEFYEMRLSHAKDGTYMVHP